MFVSVCVSVYILHICYICIYNYIVTLKEGRFTG